MTKILNKTEDTVTISKEDYIYLEMRDFELQCMEEYGVDNWNGCEECFRDDEGNDRLEETEKELRKFLEMR